MTKQLPLLVGTPAQLDWAEKIRTRALQFFVFGGDAGSAIVKA